MAHAFFFHAPRIKNRSVKAPIPNAIAQSVPVQSITNLFASSLFKYSTSNVQNTSLKTKKIEPVTMAFFRDDILL